MKVEHFKDDNEKETRFISDGGTRWLIKDDVLMIDVDRMNIDAVNPDGTVEVELKGGFIPLLAENIEQLYTECEGYKETIEVLQRQLEKERNINAFKTECEELKKDIVQVSDKTDPELYTAMKILIARHNETLMENNRLRKRNEKLKQDFESIKGHLRVAQHKLDGYGREKHYSEICIDSYSGQRLTFKNAKASTNSNGEVTVIGESVNNLIERLNGLIDTEARFTEWQDIVLKQVEANPGLFNKEN